MCDIVDERYDETTTGNGIYWSSLAKTIAYRDFDEVKKELESGVLREKDAWNPLHLAVELEYPEMIELLIQNGASVDSVLDFEDSTTPFLTPLHGAVQKNNLEIARILLKNGASVSSEIQSVYDPIHLAVFFGHEEMVALLLDYGANVNARFSNKFFEKTKLNLLDIQVLGDEMHKSLWYDQDLPLLHCSIIRKFDDVTKLLLERDADVHLKTNSGKTTLMQALESNNFDLTEHLITKKNANVNDRDFYGQPVLHFLMLTANRKISKYSKEECAGQFQKSKILKILIQHGADVNARFPEDSKYSSIIYYMIQYGFWPGVETLLFVSELDHNTIDISAIQLAKINTEDFTPDIVNDLHFIQKLRKSFEMIVDFLIGFAISRQIVGLFVDKNLILEHPIHEWVTQKKFVMKVNFMTHSIKKELDKMKNTTIGDNNITLYHLLTCKMSELVKLMSNKRLNIKDFMHEFLQIHKVNLCQSKLYFYNSAMRSKIKLAEFRNYSSKQCTELVYDCLFNKLPMDCCEIIVSYFDDDALSEFTRLLPDEKN